MLHFGSVQDSGFAAPPDSTGERGKWLGDLPDSTGERGKMEPWNIILSYIGIMILSGSWTLKYFSSHASRTELLWWNIYYKYELEPARRYDSWLNHSCSSNEWRSIQFKTIPRVITAGP